MNLTFDTPLPPWSRVNSMVSQVFLLKAASGSDVWKVNLTRREKEGAEMTEFIFLGHDEVNVSIQYSKQAEEGLRLHLNHFPEFFFLSMDGKSLRLKTTLEFLVPGPGGAGKGAGVSCLSHPASQAYSTAAAPGADVARVSLTLPAAFPCRPGTQKGLLWEVEALTFHLSGLEQPWSLTDIGRRLDLLHKAQTSASLPSPHPLCLSPLPPAVCRGESFHLRAKTWDLSSKHSVSHAPQIRPFRCCFFCPLVIPSPELCCFLTCSFSPKQPYLLLPWFRYTCYMMIFLKLEF